MSQTTYNSSDRSGRLNPGICHSRYWHLRLLARELRDLVSSRELPAGEKLLDYGCGNSPYEPLFAGKFEQYVGADLPGNPAAGVTIDSGGRLPLEDGVMEGVLSTQVLEHVEDPALYLAEAHRVLRPGGSLVLSTHGFWKYHPDPTDYWRWTADGLMRILEEAGFCVVSMRSVLGMASVAVQFWQDATISSLPRPLQPAYAGAMQALIGLIERTRGGRFSQNASVYVVLARKR